MNLTALYWSNAALRVTLKTLVFAAASCAAIFFAATGYGLLKLLLSGLSGGASIGTAELLTHSGSTLGCFVLAGIGAVVAKKCLS